jgi:hypothetical protein
LARDGGVEKRVILILEVLVDFDMGSGWRSKTLQVVLVAARNKGLLESSRQFSAGGRIAYSKIEARQTRRIPLLTVVHPPFRIEEHEKIH